MRYILAAALGAGLTAGAAQATVYQYDVTMERTRLILPLLEAYGDNQDVPESRIPGVECRESANSWGGYECRGNGDFTEDRMGLDILDAYDQTVSASFVLDTENHFADQSTPCVGPEFVCRYITSGDAVMQIATSEGFSLSPASISYAFRFTDEELSLLTDEGFSFNLDGIDFFSPGYAGLQLGYAVTDLNIAPIPLPASLPLLGVGIAAVGFVARRRKT